MEKPVTWQDAVATALASLGGTAKPKEIAEYISKHKLRKKIKNMDATVRRTLQIHDQSRFKKKGGGAWSLRAGAKRTSGRRQGFRSPQNRKPHQQAATWREAVRIALKAKGGEAHYIDIADYIEKHGLRKKIANPTNTVNRTLQIGLDTIFERRGAGVWALHGTPKKQALVGQKRQVEQIIEEAEDVPVKGLYLLVNLRNELHTAGGTTTHVVYIGKGAGTKGLQGRLIQYDRGIGLTKSVKAWYNNPDTVLIPLPLRLTGSEEEQRRQVDRLEKALLKGFEHFYGSIPTANGHA